jgi:hypothetical protein
VCVWLGGGSRVGCCCLAGVGSCGGVSRACSARSACVHAC